MHNDETKNPIGLHSGLSTSPFPSDSELVTLGYEKGRAFRKYDSDVKEMIESAMSDLRGLAEAAFHGGLARLRQTTPDYMLEALKQKLMTLRKREGQLRERLEKEDQEHAQAATSFAAREKQVAKPQLAKFIVISAFLGLIFGMIAAATISDVLFALLPPESTEGAHSWYLASGAGIGIFIGVIVGVFPLLVTRYMEESNWFVSYGPFFVGLLIAIGLGGYRIMATDPETGHVSLHVSRLGIVLLFLEVAILIAMEFSHQVLKHAYARWREFDRKTNFVGKELRESEQADVEHKRIQTQIEAVELEIKTYTYYASELSFYSTDPAREQKINDLFSILKRGFDNAISEKRAA